MGDDEPQVGYRREWVPPVKDVLPCKALLRPCKALLRPCGSGSDI